MFVYVYVLLLFLWFYVFMYFRFMCFYVCYVYVCVCFFIVCMHVIMFEFFVCFQPSRLFGCLCFLMLTWISLMLFDVVELVFMFWGMLGASTAIPSSHVELRMHTDPTAWCWQNTYFTPYNTHMCVKQMAHSKSLILIRKTKYFWSDKTSENLQCLYKFH